jgi:regulator of replication initiation timing
MEDINELKEEIKKLKLENEELRKRLKKYTNPERNKRYYQKNKEKVIKKANERLKNLPKEKIQEYSKRAYQNKISK